MKKLIIIIVCFGAFTAYGQKLKDFKTDENWYDFKSQKTDLLKINSFSQNYKPELGLTGNELLVEKRREKDKTGRVHVFYRHFLGGIEVEGSELMLHSTADEKFTEVVNDKLTKEITRQAERISKDDALKKALSLYKSARFAWDDPAAETEIKEDTKNPAATNYPSGRLIYAKAKNKPQHHSNYQLCYRFEIYSVQPLFKKAVYIDAETGSLFKETDLIISCNNPATATTLYNGTQSIITDWKGWPWNRYILIDCNNRNIHTKYGAGINPEAESGSTTWGTNHPSATSAHWAAEMTWDLYRLVYGRNGTNNGNREVKVLVDHENLFGDPLINNANYHFTGGNDKVRIGRTSAGNRSLATLDIVGHEITHGLTNATADLNYEGQSGALNESFSDIFGFMVERRAQAGVFDWRMGEDAFQENGGIRDLVNPNLYGDPAFVGQPGFWTGDNADVHTNSGVPNRWFSILSNGGFQNGVNVNPIGIDNAALIAWHTLVFNLGQSSNFNDARNASINVARWLFGECSNELIQTTQAWAAVGVGNQWVNQTINLIPVFSQDCSSVTVFANVPAASVITWFTDNGLLINGNPSPFTAAGNSVVISSPNGVSGTISATLPGCQTNALVFCPCVPWDNPTINWIWSAPRTGEPLQAEVTPAHPDAISYQWFINGQLVETTNGTFLSTYNWPCTSEGEGLTVVAVTPCGVSAPVGGGNYSPICYGRERTDNIKLYPNPASSHVTITLENLRTTTGGQQPQTLRMQLTEITQVKVMDKLGLIKKVVRFGKGNKTVTLNLNELPADIYYLDISDGKNQTRIPLSIRR